MKVQQIWADGEPGIVHAAYKHTEGILGGYYSTLCGLELRDYDWTDSRGRRRKAPMVAADDEKPNVPVNCKRCLGWERGWRKAKR